MCTELATVQIKSIYTKTDVISWVDTGGLGCVHTELICFKDQLKLYCMHLLNKCPVLWLSKRVKMYILYVLVSWLHFLYMHNQLECCWLSVCIVGEPFWTQTIKSFHFKLFFHKASPFPHMLTVTLTNDQTAARDTKTAPNFKQQSTWAL